MHIDNVLAQVGQTLLHAQIGTLAARIQDGGREPSRRTATGRVSRSFLHAFQPP